MGMNLKDKILIDADYHDLEIWNIEEGAVTSLKFDNQVFVKQKGEEKIPEIPESKKDTLNKEPTKKRKGGWSSKEEEIIRKHYPTMVASEIVKRFLPNRTEATVSRRAVLLKIRKDRFSKEDELIKKHYPTMATSEFVKKFLPDRTERSIYKRAYDLKIKKDKQYKKQREVEAATKTIETELTKFDKKPEAREWTVKEEDFLRDNFFKMGEEGIVKNNLLNRTEKEIRAKARQMGMIC